MTHLPVVSGKKLVKALGKIGFKFITREGIPTQFTAGMNRYNLAEGKLQSVKKYLVSLLRGSLLIKKAVILN